MTLRFSRAGLALVVLVAGCGDRGPEIALRYHPPAGSVFRYILEQHNTMAMESGPMAGMGKQQLVMRMYFSQSVTGPAPGGSGTEVVITFDSVGMEAPGVPPEAMARELGQFRGMKVTVVFDERAQVVRTDFGRTAGASAELAAQMTSGIKAMAFAFPAEPVGPGDSWTVMTELPLGQLPGVSSGSGGAARTTLTVRSVDIANGDTSVVLGVTTAFPEEPIVLDLGGQQANLRLAGSFTGEQFFSITRGAVVRSAIKGKARMSITASGLGAQAMEMTSDAETTLRLLDGP